MSITRRKLLKNLAIGSAAALAATSTRAASHAAGHIMTPAPSTKPEGQPSSSTTPKTPQKRPNLLMIFPDEMRAQALGFMKQDPVITPNLDKFAKESVVVTEMASNYPLCSPFRGMLMTGQYPYRNNVQGNSHTGVAGSFGGSDFGMELNVTTKTWSDVLKTQNYSLGYIGKWHLDCPKPPFIDGYNNPEEGRYWNDWTPPERRHGFDFWYSYGTYDLHLNPMYWTNDTPKDKPLRIHQWSPEHEADMAIKYLRNEEGKYRDNDKPFALVVSMNPPHSPYNQVPQKYLDRYKDKTSKELNSRPNVDWDAKYQEGYGPIYFKEYMAMINGVDEQFGRIVDELDRLGLGEDTLVVFFSDHGCCMGSHAEPSKNVHYEESMHVPMMMRWLGKLAPRVDPLLMSAPDIYPTVLSLMGFADHIPGSVEGSDLADIIQTGRQENRPTSQLFIHMPYGGQSYGRRGVRTERYTLMIERKVAKPLKIELFDNQQDPYQMHNIAEQDTALVTRLIDEELIPWLERTGDPWRPTVVPHSAIKEYVPA